MKGGKDKPDYKGFLHGGDRSGTYRELISRATETAITDKMIADFKKHSEFKKPYYDDEFPEMEHFYSGPVQFPGLEWQTAPPTGPSECWDVCKKNHSGVYFDDDCFVHIWMDTRLSLRDDIAIIDNSYSVKMERIADASISGTVRAIYKSVSSVDANTNVIWTVIQPLFEACPGVDDRAAKSCRKTYNEDEMCAECPAEIVVEYDDASSADTVARSASASVAVLYGVAPYSWAVAGSGFTMTSAKTSGVSNTINADGTACGTATITITDACGDTAIGYVRCTTGTWTTIETKYSYADGPVGYACGSEFLGARQDVKVGSIRYKVVGKYRVGEVTPSPLANGVCDCATCTGIYFNDHCLYGYTAGQAYPEYSLNCAALTGADRVCVATCGTSDPTVSDVACRCSNSLIDYCVDSRFKQEWTC